MTKKVLVGYDGSGACKRALEFAVARAQERGSAILIAHVLEWSPYTFLTPTELEERHKRRAEEMKRAEEALLAPVVAEVAAQNVPVETALRYGHISDTLCEIAKETGVQQIILGRDGSSSLSQRLFGSVASSVAQAATVPVTIVP